MEPEQTHEPWAVTDEGSAAWAVDRVLTARERLARVKANCERLVSEAEREVRDAEAYFLPLLELWARANPPRKGKSLRLHTGVIAFRTVPGGPRVVDQAAALAWAKQHCPDAVRVREELAVATLKAHVEASAGELPDGVDIVSASEVFSVKEL